MDSSATKPRSERATHEQLEIYISFCQAHPEMGTGKNNPKSPQQIQDLWKQLADNLNACRGPTRTAAKWKETLGVWKSQLRTRARRLKMSQRLTGGGPSIKQLTQFEEMALATFGSAAVDGVQSVGSFGLTLPHEQAAQTLAIECPTSPVEIALQSPLPLPSHVSPLSPVPSPSSILSPLSVSENQSDGELEAITTRPCRRERSKLIDTLISNIARKNAVEEQRQCREEEERQEHREVMKAIQGLTSCVAELINVLKQNCNK